MPPLPLVQAHRAVSRGHVGAARMFRSAPQSLPGFVAAMLEPSVTAMTLVASHAIWDEPFGRPSMVLLLLALMLTFPGTARFRDPPLTVAMDIAAGWVWMVAVLFVGGYATASLDI